MAHVYILKSNKSNKYYVGSTTDLLKRLKHHKNGHTPSTKRLGDISLVFSQEYSNLKDARIIEKKLKKLKRRDYVEKIINEGIIKMKA